MENQVFTRHTWSPGSPITQDIHPETPADLKTLLERFNDAANELRAYIYANDCIFNAEEKPTDFCCFNLQIILPGHDGPKLKTMRSISMEDLELLHARQEAEMNDIREILSK